MIGHDNDYISVAHPDLPDVEMKVLKNGMESVLVLLEWSQLPGNATVYTVDMIPQPNNVAFIQNTTIVHLQLSYNTWYDVNVTATLCGYRNSTTMVTLYFGECMCHMKFE